MHRLFCFITSAIGLLLLNPVQAQYKSKSVLSEGSIYKIGLEYSGVYKLSFEDLQNNTDFDLNNLNSNHLHIYSNSGGLLPLPNEDSRTDDLEELALLVYDGGDNQFNPGDYFLFYGRFSR